MERFVVGHARGADWTEACRQAAVAIEGRGGGANIGFLYVTDAFAEQLPAIRRFFQERTGIATWIGAVGVGICATGIEYFDEPAVAVMLAAFPAGQVLPFHAADGAPASVRAATESFAAAHGGPVFGILHADPRAPELQAGVEALAAAGDAYLVGALLSSRGRLCHVAGSEVLEGGLSGALFAPQVAVASGLTQGCSPIGPLHRITGARGNIVLTLDERPALEVFKEEIGDLLARDLRRTVGYIFAALPIPGSDRGDYRVRNITGVGAADGVFAVAERVSVGQSLMFCRRDPDSARRDLGRMLDGVRARGGAGARGGVYFNCVARGPNLFGTESQEMQAIQRALGDVPLVGFFGNGEICHDRLYGYTGVIGLFL